MSGPANILIHITRAGAAGGPYAVDAELDDGSYFSGGQLLLDQNALLAAQLDARAYGQELDRELFAGPILRAYDRVAGRAAALADDQGEGRLRVQLWIDEDADELQVYNWERLFHLYKGQELSLATSASTPFSRYISLEIAEAPPLTERPIRILAALSNPSDLPEGLKPVDVNDQVEALHQALGDLASQELVAVTVMPGRSGLDPALRKKLEKDGYRILDGPTSLDNLLRGLQGCHVCHYIGHGAYRQPDPNVPGTAALYLETEQGVFHAARDSEIVEKLAQADPLPRLVFLSACESARRDPGAEHGFIGLGPRLVQAGVAAVVAMQDLVPVDLARQLNADFYRRLLEHGEVDRAMNQSRLLLFNDQRADWSIPVLFMRLKTGQLFAADPVRLALQAIRDRQRSEMEKRGYLPIPIEVAHLAGDLSLDRLRRVGQDPLPAMDLLDITLQVFDKRRAQPGVSGQPQGAFVVVAGIPGSSKSTQLRRLVLISAENSLKPGISPLTVPVYVDLRGLSTVSPGTRSRLEVLILQNLQEFWPALDPAGLDDLLDGDGGPVLRMILDGGDELPDDQRQEAWDEIQSLARGSPHEFIVAVDLDEYSRHDFKSATDLLVIQPLSQRKVEQFLQGLSDPVGPRLYRVLAARQLFDLASIPWSLLGMLRQAQEGRYPQSRRDVLEHWVDDAINRVSPRYGMRSRSGRSLYALAWEMQSRRSLILPVKIAFELMSSVRGNREYSLEELFDELVKSNLLAGVGADSLRFNYPALQAYCCARQIVQRSDRNRILDDITASLGRLSRMRWWEDVLVLASRMLRNPNSLLRMMVYGVNLAQSEQLYLLARCLLENRGRQIDPQLENQVFDVLVRQLDGANEPRQARRAHAAIVLGQLQRPQTIPALARAAFERVRTNWQGMPTYEYSGVRMAAAKALQVMMPRYEREIHNANPRLADLLHLWCVQDAAALGERLRSEEIGSQAIAAFALGEIDTAEAVDCLVSVFLDADTPAQTGWAVTDALALVDPSQVASRAILPLLDKAIAKKQNLDPRTWRRRARWYERLAYLIGKVRAQDATSAHFLDRCLYEFHDIGIKAHAIQSLGWLNRRSYKELFEQIAAGDLHAIVLSDNPDIGDVIYLRRRAIEALARIGDLDSLNHLRRQRGDWDSELEEAFYYASEEINSRLAGFS
jgi:HEAT repeat protein